MTEYNIYSDTYTKHLQRLKNVLASDKAYEQAIGGNFLAVGQLELGLLRQQGLKPGQMVIDVGCGSGRLAAPLAGIPGIRYLGIDVVEDLLDYARKICNRNDWQFVKVNSLSIPASDQVADFVVFFSVLTHLRHEDSYKYLAEASRVLKPGGFIIISFLEFRISSHWYVFQGMLNNPDPHKHIDQFIDRDAIHAWTQHLGLTVDAIYDGDKPHIPLLQTIIWDDGRSQTDLGNLGQSVAILRKPLQVNQNL
ncbi:class I SAM-dependent methyltransferase [Arthrospira platensis]|jgi:2-polyprenyl-3-methyl-5-hydroxy-6-metoxy-1,4-benzoquinol methylase|uniref:Methyltransferase n=3 Tax=Oscillatoriales TaxID=1150 RepID=A0A5M3T8N0_LIMPL|nr:class I SAM-dependent methyltransferase [Arthrospira platensis]AMW30934.1 methyltransferase type 11 [Arthrospira platensis YZ]MBD2667776.1 class I SAM-dependent methyltransferase [Arthrospira platensis FACHB-439]MBD2711136.1 class I SAM-dependent methyltransferase [Arthrospira platensis FACHB-835]MDT9295806.1 class I SAM-dependent methyltransferase [Arthrospira platensis PCC 7345]MDT9311401.1 class I SAM-dependent methyltransferase [Limnospira sp. Paracas R14]QQW28835.1 class I SAM-depende